MKSELKNKVLEHMANLLEQNRLALKEVNKMDMLSADPADLAMYDRLKIDDQKIDSMIQSLQETVKQEDPVGKEKYSFQHPQGMNIVNRTAPFGTILIIYESRPDVTIEAAAIAFKAGNRILLKGGKEARQSNLLLVDYWHQSLQKTGLDLMGIQYLDYTREQTTELLRSSHHKIDLVVPRGGDALIAMVKSLSSAPVLVSGRGNNFIYVHEDADVQKAKSIILNSKLHKISVCNATDKVLINKNLPECKSFILSIAHSLIESGCELWGDASLNQWVNKIHIAKDDQIMYEEFLAKKILFALVETSNDAIDTINRYSGGHTAVIITEDTAAAGQFMEKVDAASVIHNASSRYTDGGQFGLGAELAISTDKLHHRGPLGLDHLVTNKWYVYGNGQIRN